MTAPRHSPRKRLAFFAIASLLSLTLLTLLGEALLRCAVFIRNQKVPTRTTVNDDYLGHKALENLHWQGIVKDASGQAYPLSVSTDRNGFRRFGDTASSKKKVLFLGDSFTHAIEASDGKTYFDLLGDSLGIAVFAYGCRGYGTLQELMLLERWQERIRPDVVVLQACFNDFVNNDWELERRSQYNNLRRRPYLIGDSVVYASPTHLPSTWLNEHSLLFQMAFEGAESLLNHGRKEAESADFQIERQGSAYLPFARSVQCTEALLRKMQAELLPTTQLVVFTVSVDQPHLAALDGICQRLQIPFVEGVPAAIDSLECKGLNMRALDKMHWNERGHEVCAEVLAGELRCLLLEGNLDLGHTFVHVPED